MTAYTDHNPTGITRPEDTTRRIEELLEASATSEAIRDAMADEWAARISAMTNAERN